MRLRASVFGLIRIVCAVAVLAGVLPVMPDRAFAGESAASAWAVTDHSRVRLIAASETVGGGPAVSLGLQFKLAEGWEIYWRSPGDAGYPPRIDWQGSSNLAAAEITWPAPVRFSVQGFETLGYRNEVVLPIRVRVARPDEPIEVRASLDYLACAEICVPHRAELTLALAPGRARPSEFAHLISRYAAKVPIPGPAAGLRVVSAELAGNPEQPLLRIVGEAEPPFTAPDVVVEGPEVLAFGAPKVEPEEKGRRAVFTVPVYGAEALGRSLAGTPLTITLIDPTRAIEQRVVVGAGGPVSGTGGAEATFPLWAGLALGLLGGLILNLMPCVLPVLSIKLLGVIGHGGSRPRTVRISFLASAAGVLFSFLILAAAVVWLQAAGTLVGWGLQFQQPWFLVALSLVIGLFAANMWGWFEIGLPRLIADAGEAVSHVHGLGGHFLAGALATVLATPCSAPFLGTAIGFALARGPGDIFAVFAAVGLGLALPYLAVAAFPGIVSQLPRPGPWMTVLRRILAVALAGTAGWLLLVLAAQIGGSDALMVAALVLVAVGAVSLAQHLPKAGGRIAVTAGLVAGALAFVVPQGGPAGDDSPLREWWAAFDEGAIPALVADGRVVLVNISAEWCITCKVNESLVLTADPVTRKLSELDAVAMMGDWTRPSDVISRYLARFGRYGIPFDAVYGPGTPSGEALPELLTVDIVLAALERAASSPRALAGAKGGPGAVAPH